MIFANFRKDLVQSIDIPGEMLFGKSSGDYSYTMIFRGAISQQVRTWKDSYLKAPNRIAHVRRNDNGDVEFEPSLYDRISPTKLYGGNT